VHAVPDELTAIFSFANACRTNPRTAIRSCSVSVSRWGSITTHTPGGSPAGGGPIGTGAPSAPCAWAVPTAISRTRMQLDQFASVRTVLSLIAPPSVQVSPVTH